MKDVGLLNWLRETARPVSYEALREYYVGHGAMWPNTTAADALVRLRRQGIHVGDVLFPIVVEPLCEKVRYETQLDAERALATMIMSPRLRRREQRAYHCPTCGGYHLTSQPQHRARRDPPTAA
jgi:hypothetical protein